ncbi:MAG: histidine kinase [Oscillospiraceae bacterium]|nr:histidine kinase [Oscillospiraceae bacterium]
MNGWNDFFYYFIIGSTLLLSTLGLCFIAIMPGIDRWKKRFFRSFFIVLMLNDCTVMTDIVLRAYSAPVAAIRFVQVLECLLLALPLPMLTVFLLHCCGENMRQSRLLHAVLGLWAAYFLLALSGLVNSAFFFVTPDRQVHRGLWYPLMLLPAIAIMLLNDTAAIRRRRLLSHKVYMSFFIALIPMTVTVLVQTFVDAFLLLDVCMVLSALSMYGLVLSDQIEQDLCQQREIAQQRASIMVLQMRPHFIYNTMTSIYCLCSQDPEKAQQVVMDFTTYLRKNFTAVASAAPIPFSSELEHTRAYLAVEQAQFSKSLTVEYDTPHTFFRVPPLTLQPIVENAVKHGRDPNAGPLHISIRTRKTDTGSEITVSDNGCGYDPADDSEPHIALKNIRQRLELMCGGSLTITPNDGGGTTVTVTIPDSVNPNMIENNRN